MNQELEKLINLLASKSINYHDFITKANNILEIKELFEPKDLLMWKTLGIDICKQNGKICLKTQKTKIEDETFCFVDIETNGGMKNGQIIEIGALKIKNGKMIDKFESLIYAKEIPENIIEITGIHPYDLENAPTLPDVLEKFRLFLGSSVFVAHNVNFDYNFISKSLNELGFGFLLNRKICTIELSRRTINAPRYALSYLKELLDIQNTHHRAFNDAISCAEIFKYCLTQIPKEIITTEDLIYFSKNAKTKANQEKLQKRMDESK